MDQKANVLTSPQQDPIQTNTLLRGTSADPLILCSIRTSTARSSLKELISTQEPQFFHSGNRDIIDMFSDPITIKPLPETMLASEEALARDWDTPEEDSAWAGL